MKKLTITSILALCMVCPAMADIAKEATSATCDNSTIGTTTGPANLEADWTANIINLDFYSDGVKVSSGTCTYDGSIELPEDPEDKTGYTFGGWQMRRAPQQTTFDLSIFDNWEFDESTRYGDEWSVDFTNGATVYGLYLCSSTNGEYSVTGSPDENSNGKYCWCKGTGVYYGDDSQTFPSSPWVFAYEYDDFQQCYSGCFSACAGDAVYVSGFRTAVFGQN